MYHYTLRVDTTNVDRDQLTQRMLQDSSIYCYCYEGGIENPHMHFYMESNIVMQTLRTHLRKFNLKGNKDYSLAQLRESKQKYIAYMMKGNLFQRGNISEELYQEAVAYQEQVRKDYEEKKKGKKKVIEEIEDLCSPYLEEFDLYSHKIQEKIIEYYVKTSTQIYKARLQSLYLTLECKYTKHDKDYLINKIFNI